MSETLLTLFSFILLALGLLGTFLPILPGLILSFTGLLLLKFGTNIEIPTLYLWIFGFLTLISGILEYVIPAKTNRKYGGTQWGSIGSFFGTLIGFFWIPIPFGFLIGMLLGVLVAELLHDFNDKKKAFNSVKGTVIGFFISTGFSFTVALAMILVCSFYTFF
ncbi:MAG: DUF456 domain-containing protein [Bacteroidetes bacterium]|nr:DUF456 domain-containing protein [Bacteroidota bacterium]